jgi:hypothetical protein
MVSIRKMVLDLLYQENIWVNKELIEKLKLGVRIKISIYQIYHSLCKSL